MRHGEKRNVTGWYMLAVVIFVIAFELIAGFAGEAAGLPIDTTLLWFIRSGAIFIICLIFMKLSGMSFFEFFGFKRIRVSTFFLVILFSVLIYPFMNLISVLANLVFGNPLTDFVEDTGMGVFVIMAVVVAPFIEEVIFRGIFFRGLRRRGGFLAPVLVSACMFGLYHGNVTQFIYASVLGIFLALVVDAGGSVWCSVIVHFMFNGMSSVISFVASSSYESSEVNVADTSAQLANVVYFASIVVAFLIVIAVSVFLLWLAHLVLRVISRREGRNDVSRRSDYNAPRVSGGAYVYVPILIAAAVLSWLVLADFVRGLLGVL